MQGPAKSNPRKVHKLQLEDLRGLTPHQVADMLNDGAVEIIVAVQDSADWGELLATFFDTMAHDVDRWRHSMRNRTVIVNFVDRS